MQTAKKPHSIRLFKLFSPAPLAFFAEKWHNKRNVCSTAQICAADASFPIPAIPSAEKTETGCPTAGHWSML